MEHLEQACKKDANHGRPVGDAVTAGPPRRMPRDLRGSIYSIHNCAASSGCILDSLTKSGSLKA